MGKIRNFLAKIYKNMLPSHRFWKLFWRAAAVLTAVGLLLGVICLGISTSVSHSQKKSIKALAELQAAGERYDCILVLGCRVYPDGRLSDMLADRVLTGVELYFGGLSDRLLMSGDHRTDAYNEVDAMKEFAKEQGVPSEAIFLDHDGYSTYDSVLRAKETFGAEKLLIVTQEYHLSRALYLADRLGLEADGVSADRRGYSGQLKRDLREILARCKDVWYGYTKPEPEVISASVDLSGDGDLTAAVRP